MNEDRLHNLEVAFLAYVALTKDLLPPEYQKTTHEMLEEYFAASSTLGAEFTNRFIFK